MAQAHRTSFRMCTAMFISPRSSASLSRGASPSPVRSASPSIASQRAGPFTDSEHEEFLDRFGVDEGNTRGLKRTRSSPARSESSVQSQSDARSESNARCTFTPAAKLRRTSPRSFAKQSYSASLADMQLKFEKEEQEIKKRHEKELQELRDAHEARRRALLSRSSAVSMVCECGALICPRCEDERCSMDGCDTEVCAMCYGDFEHCKDCDGRFCGECLSYHHDRRECFRFR